MRTDSVLPVVLVTISDGSGQENFLTAATEPAKLDVRQLEVAPGSASQRGSTKAACSPVSWRAESEPSESQAGVEGALGTGWSMPRS
mmetsp:Transcript_49792/g.132060  ORF Transcript_49792/g.132060 Transcript_49792/m.132060 type:complete len:87 (+) Transcript_49792:1087-1347(+)